MQGKVDELRRKQADADLTEREMNMLEGHDSISVRQWIAALKHCRCCAEASGARLGTSYQQTESDDLL